MKKEPRTRLECRGISAEGGGVRLTLPLAAALLSLFAGCATARVDQDYLLTLAQADAEDARHLRALEDERRGLQGDAYTAWCRNVLATGATTIVKDGQVVPLPEGTHAMCSSRTAETDARLQVVADRIEVVQQRTRQRHADRQAHIRDVEEDARQRTTQGWACILDDAHCPGYRSAPARPTEAQALDARLRESGRTDRVHLGTLPARELECKPNAAGTKLVCRER